MTRIRLRAIAIGMLAGALGVPAMGAAQETKCTSCEAEDRERAVRRYQQEIERVQRELAVIQRQLAAAESSVDSATARRLNERMQQAIEKLTRTYARQAAQLQSLSERSWTAVIAPTPPPGQYMTQAIDGYIGVLWSASVHVEKPDKGDALWTFHDYPQVEAVERESPAERAGILVGDMIVAFDGKDLRRGKIPMNAVLRPGNTVTVRLTRDNRTRSVDVKVAERPRVAVRSRTPVPYGVRVPSEEFPDVVVTPAPPSPATPRAAVAPLPPMGMLSGFTVGAELIPLDATLGEPYGTEHGLLVLRVGPRTPAARAGIQKGDVLIAVDGRELRSVPALIRAVERSEKGTLRLELLRKRERKVVVMEW
jgi:C-terminal processing protease CtpA/Prc